MANDKEVERSSVVVYKNPGKNGILKMRPLAVIGLLIWPSRAGRPSA